MKQQQFYFFRQNSFKQVLIFIETLIMGKFMLICFLILITSAVAQRYPSCPGGVPIDIGNTTDQFYSKLLSLTDFMDYHDEGTLASAFRTYATTGSQSLIDEIVAQNGKFFIIIIGILGSISVILLVVMFKMGSVQLTTREIFDQVKEKGFFSPLSAFYTLLAVILLASASVNAYQISAMINSLQMTQCRMDVLNEVFLNGLPQQNWSGINEYSQKISIINDISAALFSALSFGLSNQTQTLAYASSNLQSLLMQYAGIVNTYSEAQIGRNDKSQTKINLLTLIPNLFSNKANNSAKIVLTPLIDYLTTLTGSKTFLYQFQNLVSNIFPSLNLSYFVLSSIEASLKTSSAGYTQHYTSFRSSLVPFFQDSRQILIVCEFITAVTIFGTIISLFSFKIIQSNYDYFSLKIYKIIWTCMIILFCLNLVFLLIFNEMIIYNTGMCDFAHELIGNRLNIQSTFPSSQVNGNLYFFTACYFESAFDKITHSDALLQPILQFVKGYQYLQTDYSPEVIGSFLSMLASVQSSLKDYQYGVEGIYPYMDNQLASINSRISTNYKNQNCFKHHWVYSVQNCKAGQAITIMPTSLTYIGQTSNYNIAPSQCYVLSNSSINSTPSVMNHSTFSALYSTYSSECPYTNVEMSTKTVIFFDLFQRRINAIQGLMDSIVNLTSFIMSTDTYLLTYINSRIPLITNTFKNIPDNATYAYLSSGNDCRIIKNLVNGIYNEYCINFRANSHQIYLLVVCNIVYIIGLIVFSLLYAIELSHISEKDLRSSHHTQHSLHSNHNLSSDSHSDLNSDQEHNVDKNHVVE